MKKIINSTIFAIFFFLATYLVGCFTNNSFDLSKWEYNNRGFIAGFGFILAIISFVSSYIKQCDDEI